jgi:hypothetical protein
VLLDSAHNRKCNCADNPGNWKRFESSAATTPHGSAGSPRLF